MRHSESLHTVKWFYSEHLNPFQPNNLLTDEATLNNKTQICGCYFDRISIVHFSIRIRFLDMIVEKDIETNPVTLTKLTEVYQIYIGRKSCKLIGTRDRDSKTQQLLML